jgi:hypothetical protein
MRQGAPRVGDDASFERDDNAIRIGFNGDRMIGPRDLDGPWIQFDRIRHGASPFRFP